MRQTMEVAKVVDDVSLVPALWGVDHIEYVPDPAGRYVIKVPVPGLFVWNSSRQREVECPRYDWWINGKRFSGVVALVVDYNGNIDFRAMREELRRMIAESKSDGGSRQ